MCGKREIMRWRFAEDLNILSNISLCFIYTFLNKFIRKLRWAGKGTIVSAFVVWILIYLRLCPWGYSKGNKEICLQSANSFFPEINVYRILIIYLFKKGLWRKIVNVLKERAIYKKLYINSSFLIWIIKRSRNYLYLINIYT